MKSLLVVLLLVSTAEAKDKPEIAAAKTLLDAQASALNKHDAKAFGATFDDGAYLVFPSTTEAAKRAAIESAAGDWMAVLDPVQVKVEHALYGSLGDTKCAWITAELVETSGDKTRFRVTEFVAPLQSGVETPTAADYRVQSAMISEAMDDKASIKAAQTDSLPALGSISGGQTGDDFLGNPVTIARDMKLSTDAAVSVIGSAPSELATGKAAAGKLKEFSGLKQKLVQYTNRGDMNSMNAASSVIGHVEITYKIGGKPVVIPYRVMAIFAGPPPATQGPTVLAVLHYSVAPR